MQTDPQRTIKIQAERAIATLLPQGTPIHISGCRWVIQASDMP
jgi:hypothetical protein